MALGGAQTTETITLMRLFDTFIPVATSALAIWAIATYPITEATAARTRAQLEARRGATAA